MKSKIKNNIVLIFITLYTAFAAACCGVGWLFDERRLTVLQIWYKVTVLIWIVFVITMIILMIKSLKLYRLKNEIKHWKE